MIQVQHKLTGNVIPCGSCGRMPKYYSIRGSNTHMLECSPCGTRTPKSASLAIAVRAWEAGERIAVSQA